MSTVTQTRNYFCSEEFTSLCFSVQIILIQKFYRRWLAKRYVDKLKEDKRKRLEWERLEEIRKQKEKEDRIKREFERRMQPKTKEDFDLLYAALESESDFLASSLVFRFSGVQLAGCLVSIFSGVWLAGSLFCFFSFSGV